MSSSFTKRMTNLELSRLKFMEATNEPKKLTTDDLNQIQRLKQWIHRIEHEAQM